MIAATSVRSSLAVDARCFTACVAGACIRSEKRMHRKVNRAQIVRTTTMSCLSSGLLDLLNDRSNQAFSELEAKVSDRLVHQLV